LAFTECLGFEEETLLMKPFVEMIHPDDLPGTGEAIARLKEGQLVVRFENRYLHRDGNYLWLEWNAVPDEKGEVIYAAARNVTERKQMENELRRSNAELEQLLLGICFWREAPETAGGADRRAGKRGLSNDANGSFVCHSGCCGARVLMRSIAKKNWKYIGCSAQRQPSLSNVAMRSASGTKSDEPSFDTFSTKVMIDCLGAVSFHEGRGSAAKSWPKKSRTRSVICFMLL
jgi:PAS domain S-box-containing protein